MNKVITAIVIILIIVGGYFLFFNKSNTPTTDNTTTSAGKETINPSASTNTAKKVTVNYTDNGFSPASITIKKGDTVVFVNQSSGSMWAASNPHPIHTDYSAFDEKATVDSGGSWSFTFEQVGTWSYHNHKSPSDTGTVVVE